jgi:hypothetical protein
MTLHWIVDNRQWLFDGAAVVLPIALVGAIANRWNAKRSSRGDDSRNTDHIEMKQKGGRGSTNIQSLGSIDVGGSVGREASKEGRSCDE